MQKSKPWFLYAVIIVLLFTVFFLPIENQFQADSEALVIGSLVYDDMYGTYPEYGLQQISSDAGDAIKTRASMLYNLPPENIELSSYKSQIGLQGFVFLTLYKLLPIATMKHAILLFRGMCALAMAVTAAALIQLINKKYNWALAAAFFVTFFMSPWIKNFGANLFWVSFTWFVPMLLGLWLTTDYEKHGRWWLYLLVFAAVFVKCACGYEYVSTVMVGLVMFPVCDLFAAEPEKRKKILLAMIKLSLAALAAFAAAMILHAGIRGGGNIKEGISLIWRQDAVRRTLGGDPADYDPAFRTSMEASIPEVVAKYFVPKADILEGVPGHLFIALCAVSLLILVMRRVKQKAKWELPLFAVSLFGALSWFVLAKSHSYLHLHMNYVLWYFGFVQTCVYSLITLFSDRFEIKRKE